MLARLVLLIKKSVGSETFKFMALILFSTFKDLK